MTNPNLTLLVSNKSLQLFNELKDREFSQDLVTVILTHGIGMGMQLADEVWTELITDQLAGKVQEQ